MGRGRLRRGYSLEVIFEEDPDFCSHLDSLDSVAIRFGVKEVDDTISVDSLVEEYQIRFQARADKEHVFRSLDGIWDVKDMDSCFVEWDEFSTDSLSKMPPTAATSSSFQPTRSTKLDGDVEIPSSGRRSRVSRRQIVEASWVFDSSEESGSSNSSTNGVEEEGNKQDFIEPQIQPVLLHSTGSGSPNPNETQMHGHPALISTAVDVHNTNTMHSSNPIRLPIDIRLHGNSDGGESDDSPPSPPRALFGNLCRVVDGADKDTLDSYISTRTDDMEGNAYNFADPFNDTASVASTTYESSASTSSTGSVGSVCTVNSRSNLSTPKSSANNSNSSSPSDPFGPSSKYRSNLNVELKSRFLNGNCKRDSVSPPSTKALELTSSNNTNSSSEPTMTDVKRVRALFEIPNMCSSNSPPHTPSRKSSLGEESSTSGGSTQRLYSKNPSSSPTNSSGSGGGSENHGVHRKLKHLGLVNQHQIVGKVLRSAYSQFNLNQQQQSSSGGCQLDFAELLVNDNLVIEDSSDVYQTLKNRNRGLAEIGGSKKLTSNYGYPSTLRRSRSMGTGISSLGDSPLDKITGIRTSRTSIIAEEMPAPDTVKNVRTVFEQILKMRNSSTTTSHSDNNNNQSLPNNSGNSFSIIKKSLSSVKSNPTSKIYRSESMRDDFPISSSAGSLSPNRKFGKPILLETGFGSCGDNSSSISPVSKTSSSSSDTPSQVSTALKDNFTKKKPVERKYSEPIKFAPKINSPVTTRSLFRDPSADIVEVINQTTLTEEDLSLLSSLTDTDNPPKRVSPDVLQRIRSCGTTTTYFGGQVIAQTIKNRKLPLSRRHTLMDFQDFNPGDYYSSNSNSTSGSSRHTEEFFTPPSTPTAYNQRLGSSVSTSTNNNRRYDDDSFQYQQTRASPMLDLESMFAGVLGLNGGSNKNIDTKPRIISVVPKSPSGSGSPTKSISPVGSITEGRGRETPEGCEGQDDTKCQWINEIPIVDVPSEGLININKSPVAQSDGNNNDIIDPLKATTTTPCPNNDNSDDKRFSQVAEGAWF